jgi:hypothetical protein
MRLDGPGGSAIGLRPSVDESASTIAFPITQVWRVLPLAYDSVGLVVTAMDAAVHLIDNGGVRLSRQLGGVPLSRYIDCGSVRTQLRANDSAATSVITEVQAMGRPAAFSQDYSRCSSTGKLESQLAAAILAKLQR